MKINKIGNFLLAVVAILLQLLYFGALVGITAQGPSMLANMAAEYIAPYSYAQIVLITFIFITEILLFIALFAFTSQKNRLIGGIGAGFYIFVIIFDFVFVYNMIETLINTSPDPGALMSIRLMFYILVVPPFFGIAGGLLKAAYPNR